MLVEEDLRNVSRHLSIYWTTSENKSCNKAAGQISQRAPNVSWSPSTNKRQFPSLLWMKHVLLGIFLFWSCSFSFSIECVQVAWLFFKQLSPSQTLDPFAHFPFVRLSLQMELEIWVQILRLISLEKNRKSWERGPWTFNYRKWAKHYKYTTSSRVVTLFSIRLSMPW